MTNKFTYESLRRFNEELDKTLEKKYIPGSVASAIRKFRDFVIQFAKVKIQSS